MRTGAGAVPGQAKRTQRALTPLPSPASAPSAARFPVPAPPTPHPKLYWHSLPHPNPRPEGRVPGPPLKLPGAHAGPNPSACLT